MPIPKPQKNNQTIVFLNEYFNVILFVAFIIIFIFAYLFFIGPKFKTTTLAIQDNIEAQKRLYVEQEKRLKDLKTIIKIYDEISPTDLSKFDGILPDNYVKEMLFGELEELIIQEGYLIQSVVIEVNEEDGKKSDDNLPVIGGTQSLKSGENVGSIKLNISIGAINYTGLKQLLRVIETNSRLFDIESISFGGSGESAELELVTYYYKNSQP